MKEKLCPSCGEVAHDFAIVEALDCVPPKEVLQFGDYKINIDYREALFKVCPFFTAEEIVGSYLGHNPNFPSEDDWVNFLEPEGSKMPPRKWCIGLDKMITLCDN